MLEKAIGISQVDEESKKQAKVLKDETTTIQSIMAIMKDKEEQNTLKRHRSEDTVRSQHRCKKCGTLYKWAECTQIDNTVQPICTPRNIPVALRERVREN